MSIAPSNKKAPGSQPRGVDDCHGGHAPQQSGAATPSLSSTLMRLAALLGSVTCFGGGCNLILGVVVRRSRTTTPRKRISGAAGCSLGAAPNPSKRYFP